MAKIRVLPENLANQIAAGEVVERPASVVKELIENAIDAGAARIEIDIESGGRRLIRIADDGEGMTRDDAVLSFQRHATSKISRQEDLAAISTLGFRGEALASISSVARVEMITKTDLDLAATRVRIEGGTLLDVSDAARDRGTTITVRDLFFNTPARRKFLRSEATENYHITGIVTHYALVNPEIDFRLTNNGRSVLETPTSISIRERAFQIFGAQILESLIPVNGGREFVAKVSGYVSAPRERRTNRDSQYFFVNRRFVRDRTIADALRDGYRSILPHGYFPVAFLFIEVPVEEIDVNVHPAKTEVRFRRPDAVKDVVTEAVREALAAAGIRAAADDAAPAVPVAGSVTSQSSLVREQEREIQSEYNDLQESRQAFVETLPGLNTIAKTLFEADSRLLTGEPDDRASQITKQDRVNLEEKNESPASALSQTEFTGPYPTLPPIVNAEHFLKPTEPESGRASLIRVLGQLNNSYILAADNDGLLLIDQHVAHERILFDKFRNKSGNLPSQNLLLPETLDLTPAQAEAYDISCEELELAGFRTMRLSGRTIAVKAVPPDIPASEAKMLLSEILDNVDRERRGRGTAIIRDSIAASMACKAAIKVNNPLTTEEMDWIISRLLLTSSPTTCPHGRPVILRLSLHGIEKAFERI
jgi:DNA mismatch repair protein MutL